MINLFNANIREISLHRVGNKSRNEKIFLSEHPIRIDDEFNPLMKEFFLKPFREKEENYFQFAHEVDLDYNEMFLTCQSIFKNPESVHDNSKKITKHLFEQAGHPHIKNGDLYVVYITNVGIDNHIVDAIGIFKTEIQRDFLQVEENEGNMMLEMNLQQGISLEKLDKGALIFNHREDEGYKILTIDSNKYDARYWLEHFLSVDAFEDENYKTRKYLKFVQDFAKDVVRPNDDKKEEIMFMNRGVNYFAKNDEFVEEDFMKEVMDEKLFPEFRSYKIDKGEKYNIEDVDEFPISNTAVNDMRKKFKGVINLDTNISISLNFVNPESAERFVEKGWDEERQMYYYLVYFNKEEK